MEAPDKGIPLDHIAQPIARASISRPKSQRSMDLERLGIYVATCRATAGLSQEKLAKKAGVSMDTVERVERGEVGPSYDTLYRFSKALKRTIRIKAT